MQKLSQYPQATAFRFIANACQRFEQGELNRPAFETFCESVFADGRPAVVRELALKLPIPMEIPEGDEVMSELLAALPGVRHAFQDNQLPKTEAGREMQRQREAIFKRDDVIEQLANAWEICHKHWPWWTAVLQNADQTVRLTGVSRIPTEGPLSLLLPWLSTDSVTIVRNAARAKLGIVLKVRPTTWRDYRKGLIGVDVAREEIRNPNTPVERRKAYLTDPRPRVRYETAIMLQDDDPLWLVLTSDPSPRLRRLAAERVPRVSPELRRLCEDQVASVAAIALRRAWQAWDAKEPGAKEPPQARPIRADAAARRAWKERLEAYFPEGKHQPQQEEQHG